MCCAALNSCASGSELFARESLDLIGHEAIGGVASSPHMTAVGQTEGGSAERTLFGHPVGCTTASSRRYPRAAIRLTISD